MLIAAALLLYFGGATVLSQHDDPSIKLSGLTQVVSAIAGVAATVLRQPRLAQVAGAAAAVFLLITLGPFAVNFLSGTLGPLDSLFYGLFVLLVVPPLIMLWGAFAMSRTQRSAPEP
jgi:hypothetical protein